MDLNSNYNMQVLLYNKKLLWKYIWAASYKSTVLLAFWVIDKSFVAQNTLIM